MGIENRDYLREDHTSGGGFRAAGGLEAVKWIVIANIIVYVAQLLTSRNGFVTESLSLGPGDVVGRFQIWRVISYAFCHSPHDLFHIVFNMLILYFTGRRLEPRYGSREFASFYLLAAVVSGLTYVLLELVLNRPGTAIGASGAVAACFILYAIHYPRERWLLFFVIPVEVRWLCIAYVIWDVHPVLLELGGSPTSSGVAHACHVGGYLFGFLYFKKNWHLSSAWSGMKLPKLPKSRQDSHLKVYNPQQDTAEMSTRVDEILQKISEHGESSLTKQEQEFLADASRRLREKTRS